MNDAAYILACRTSPLRRFHLFARPGQMSLCGGVSWLEVTPERRPYPKPWICAECKEMAQTQQAA